MSLAKTLRMERTRFVNPHGIDNAERSMPYSTAADMARLTRYAVNKAAFRFYVSQKERQISFSRGAQKKAYMLRNTNELLGTNGVDGVKTGRTARAGDCLILSAHRESQIIKEGERTAVIPRHLIVVMLGSTQSFRRRRATARARLAASRSVGRWRPNGGSEEDSLIFAGANDEAPDRRFDERRRLSRA